MYASPGVPHLRYESRDLDPQYFLQKLHPELYPYFQRLKQAKPSAKQAVQVSPSERLSALGAKEEQLMVQYQSHFPVLPPDLLSLINQAIGLLLVPAVYPVLLAILANDNVEILGDMLKHMPVFRKADPLELQSWDGCTCLKLLDDNWACFSERAEATPTEIMESRKSASSTNGTSPSAARSQPSGVSASRWAKPASSSPSSFSRSSAASGLSSTASSSPTFQISKIPALIDSLVTAKSDHQSVLKWSSARWSVLLDDIQLLLCKTCILPEAEARHRAKVWVETWKANVATWKG